MKLIISRTYNPNETPGSMFILFGYDLLYSCKTIELPWNGNIPNVSCIPAGTYDTIKYDSPNKGMVFLLQNVPGRDSIEIHSGNFTKDTHGCILVGSFFEDINGDGNMDLCESRKTLDKLMSILPSNFNTIII